MHLLQGYDDIQVRGIMLLFLLSPKQFIYTITKSYI